MKEYRQHIRLVHRAGVNITFASGETIKTQTYDMSNGGLFISCTEHPPLREGDLAEIIVLGIQDAVQRPIQITRIEPDRGFAIEFI